MLAQKDKENIKIGIIFIFDEETISKMLKSHQRFIEKNIIKFIKKILEPIDLKIADVPQIFLSGKKDSKSVFRKILK